MHMIPQRGSTDDAPLISTRRGIGVPLITTLKNGGSDDMSVDGSSVAVDFDYAATGEELVQSIRFLIGDLGSISSGNYGAIVSGLTNGTQLIIQSKGVLGTVATMKTNLDITMAFTADHIFNNSNGWLEADKYYFGKLDFQDPIILNATDSDFVRVKIQDDVTTLSFHVCGVQTVLAA